MKTKQAIASLMFGMLAILAGSANAQSWSKEQAEVWQVVLDSYKDIDAQDASWSERWVFPDAMVWGPDYPMPRSRDSVRRWDAYNFAGSKNHVAEYAPAAIVVHGSTAVAHYYYTNASEDREGKHETTHGRCTDVLAKDGQNWKFIAWHCGDEPNDD